jgi:hypothetical protein
MSASGRVSPHAHRALSPTRRTAVSLRPYAAMGSFRGSSIFILGRPRIKVFEGKNASGTSAVNLFKVHQQPDSFSARVSNGPSLEFTECRIVASLEIVLDSVRVFPN